MFGSNDWIRNVFYLIDCVFVGDVFLEVMIGYDDELVIMVKSYLDQVGVRNYVGVQKVVFQETGLEGYFIYSFILKL